MASRRWEAWRRGLQDANLLRLAEEALQRRGDDAGAGQLHRIVEAVVSVPGDSGRAQDAREWLRDILLAPRNAVQTP